MTQIIAGSNLDDVRAEIMRLENADHFDAEAWFRVLADLSAAGRVSGLADAKRRMEIAQDNLPALMLRKHGKTEMMIRAMLGDHVAAETLEA